MGNQENHPAMNVFTNHSTLKYCFVHKKVFLKLTLPPMLTYMRGMSSVAIYGIAPIKKLYF